MRTGTILAGLLLFVAGTVAGVVLTGRLLTRDESGVEPAAVVDTVPLETPLAAAPATPAARAAAPGGAVSLPDFTLVAEDSIRAVANISSRQVVRRRSLFSSDPFYR
ncbi:MAG: hypothetical protein F4Y57_00155 [Acidobacteria bacterium]|nr:hypothetical protein [Acidobacteriota bacterium]